MSNQARNYSNVTLKRLFGLSGGECSYPACSKRIVNTENALESNICHIEAAKEGGERYNPLMNDKRACRLSKFNIIMSSTPFKD